MRYITNGAESQRKPPGMPAENYWWLWSRWRKETTAEWTNCQTLTGDDTKLLLHNSDF